MHLPARRVLWSLGFAEAARLRGLPRSSRVGAAMAGAVLLLLEPFRARDASYVLTVAATWAIHEIPIRRPGRGAGKPALDLLRASGLAQMGAWAALPWTVARGSWIGLGANLVAVPVAASLLFVELFGVFFDLLLPGANRYWWVLARMPAGVLARLAESGSAESVGGLELHGTPLEWGLAYGAGLLLLAHGPPRYHKYGWMVCATFAVLMAMGPRASPGPCPGLRLAFLDVGQGDACIITFPAGESILVDGGGARPDWDSGRRVVRPALGTLGIHHLDLAFCSHSDNDHAGGLASLATGPGADRWILPPVAPGSRWRILERAIARAGQRPERISRGWTWVDRTGRDTVRCLYPDSSSVAAGLGENDLCLVLEISTPEGRVLLPGDLEASGEERLLEFADLRRCEILKVGHHGSRTSTTTPFLAALGRPLAVISVGLRNGYHHPSPLVEERLRDAGCVLRETRFEGAILLGLDHRLVSNLGPAAWEGAWCLSGAPRPVP